MITQYFGNCELNKFRLGIMCCLQSFLAFSQNAFNHIVNDCDGFVLNQPIVVVLHCYCWLTSVHAPL